ncbi:hypothetical protein L1987_36708 [Smallanthus sonchifolius]|uniref:Uncharacterized protein n=1 Tax=Smallanthus sonchifolius TaxID=185202 RepID=A0ACB9HF61_9ASTR|nr:hypothetical protein L1987_36708 [Smallanthus sonchifolius]
MLESDLGIFQTRILFLMEKITECDTLLMDYRVYKGKYEVVSAKKTGAEKHIEVDFHDKRNLQQEIETLKSEIDDVKMKLKDDLNATVSKMEIPISFFEKLRLQIDYMSLKCLEVAWNQRKDTCRTKK